MSKYVTVRLTQGTAALLRRLERQLAAAADVNVTHDDAVRAACTVALDQVPATVGALRASATESPEGETA